MLVFAPCNKSNSIARGSNYHHNAADTKCLGPLCPHRAVDKPDVTLWRHVVSTQQDVCSGYPYKAIGES